MSSARLEPSVPAAAIASIDPYCRVQSHHTLARDSPNHGFIELARNPVPPGTPILLRHMEYGDPQLSSFLLKEHAKRERFSFLGKQAGITPSIWNAALPSSELPVIHCEMENS